MSEEKKLFKLLLPDKENISDFVMNLMKEEAEELGNEENIGEGTVRIKTSYVCEADDKIEVGFYVRNNTNQTINFEIIPLHLVKDNKIICTQIFASKEFGDTPPKSIKFCTVYFEKENVNTEDLTAAEIKFGEVSQIETKQTIKVEVENLPSTLKKKELKHIHEYMNKLPYLVKNTVDINTYSVFYDEAGNLDIIIVVRNGCESDQKLGSLPLMVYDSRNILIYGGVFTPNNINVKPDTAVIYNIVVDEENVPIKNADLSKYVVEFK